MGIRLSPRLLAGQAGATLLLGAAALCTPAQAAVINVNTTADTPGPGGCAGAPNDCSLRQALTLANGNPDASNVIKLPGSHNHFGLSNGALTISKTLTLQGAGASNTVIDGNHASGVFVIAGGAPVTTTITDLTIANGSVTAAGSQGGGAIYSTGGLLTLTRDTLTDNTVQATAGCCNGGGAVLDLGGDLSIGDSTLTDNSVSEVGVNGCCTGGGAVRVGTGNLDVSGSSVVGNVVNTTGNQQCCNGGGGFYIETGSVTLTGTHTDGNAVTIDTRQCCNGGGGLYSNSSGGSLTVSGGSVDHNTVHWASTDCCNGGGGLYNNGSGSGDFTVTNASVSGNAATQTGDSAQCCNGGGGIFQDNSHGALSLAGVTAAGNAATITAGASSDGGGGIYDNGGTATPNSTILNTTIEGNTLNSSAASTSDGGSGYYARGPAAFTNVTLDSNRGNVPAGLFVNGAVTLANSILAGDSSGRNCTIGGGTITSSGYNIDSGDTCQLGAFGDRKNTNPLFDVLKDNGGPTLTQALLPGSPAIDAIARGDCPATDQRGFPRPDPGETTCDIGAFETPRGPILQLAGAAQLHGSRIGVVLTCRAPSGESCPTAVKLTASGTPRRGVGEKRVVIASAKAQRVTIGLNAVGRRLLARVKALPVTLTITLASGGARAPAITWRLTIRRA